MNNWYHRLNFTINADYKIKPWLTSNSSLTFTDAKWDDGGAGYADLRRTRNMMKLAGWTKHGLEAIEDHAGDVIRAAPQESEKAQQHPRPPVRNQRLKALLQAYAYPRQQTPPKRSILFQSVHPSHMACPSLIRLKAFQNLL